MKNIVKLLGFVSLISNRKEKHTKTSFLKASNKKKNHKGPEKRHITYKTQEIKKFTDFYTETMKIGKPWNEISSKRKL